MKNRTSLVLAVLATFTSCIEDYKIPDKVAESYQEELVIQGRILAGENSAIYISRTQPFGDKGNATFLSGAQRSESSVRTAMKANSPNTTNNNGNTPSIPPRCPRTTAMQSKSPWKEKPISRTFRS